MQEKKFYQLMIYSSQLQFGSLLSVMVPGDARRNACHKNRKFKLARGELLYWVVNLILKHVIGHHNASQAKITTACIILRPAALEHAVSRH